jgi:DNA polymerase III delta subunit
MLSVFHGSDRKAVIDRAQATAAKQGTPVTIDESNFVTRQFDELTAASSLFGEAGVYIIDTPSNQKDFQAEAEAALADMAASNNHFVLVEGSLLAPAKKKFAKYADTIEEFSAAKADRFNTFSVADALARKDKKSLWLLSQEAQLLGVKEEEIIGILWWQLKAIRLAASTSNAAEAGMKEYPYRKAKQALSKYQLADINRLSHSLLNLYHQGHKGVVDIKLALEQWVLKL